MRNIILKDDVKTYLQIDGTYDTLIDIYIDVVSDDVKLICNQDFEIDFDSTYTDSSNDVSVNSLEGLFDINVFEVNMIVVGDDIPGGTYITAIDTVNSELTLSAQPTASDTATLTVIAFPKAKKPIVSAMIFETIQKYSVNTTTINNSQVLKKDLESESLEDYSYKVAKGSSNYIGGYSEKWISGLIDKKKPRFK